MPEFLKVADTQTHVCVKCSTILTFERKTFKINSFNLIFMLFSVFYDRSGKFACTIYLAGNFVQWKLILESLHHATCKITPYHQKDYTLPPEKNTISPER